MNRFIRLSNIVVNTSKNVKIDCYTNKFFLYMANNDVYGTMLFSCGDISSRPNYIEVCKEKQPQDYDKVFHWIERIP